MRNRNKNKKLKKILNYKNLIIPIKENNINLNYYFKNKNSTILEIGFGTGIDTIKNAFIMPKKNFICIDIYISGILNILKKIKEKKMNNILIINNIAQLVLLKNIQILSISAIYIFFPDPWNKKDQLYRRFINNNTILLMYNILKNKSYFHFVTDCKLYALYVIILLKKNTLFKNYTNLFLKKIEKPNYRFLTKFEKNAINNKKKIFEIIFYKK